MIFFRDNRRKTTCLLILIGFLILIGILLVEYFFNFWSLLNLLIGDIAGSLMIVGGIIEAKTIVYNASFQGMPEKNTTQNQ